MCGCFSPLKPQLIVGRLTEDVELQENSNEKTDWMNQAESSSVKTGASNWAQYPNWKSEVPT